MAKNLQIDKRTKSGKKKPTTNNNKALKMLNDGRETWLQATLKGHTTP